MSVVKIEVLVNPVREITDEIAINGVLYWVSVRPATKLETSPFILGMTAISMGVWFTMIFLAAFYLGIYGANYVHAYFEVMFVPFVGLTILNCFLFLLTVLLMKEVAVKAK